MDLTFISFLFFCMILKEFINPTMGMENTSDNTSDVTTVRRNKGKEPMLSDGEFGQTSRRKVERVECVSGQLEKIQGQVTEIIRKFQQGHYGEFSVEMKKLETFEFEKAVVRALDLFEREVTNTWIRLRKYPKDNIIGAAYKKYLDELLKSKNDLEGLQRNYKRKQKLESH